MSGEFGVRWKFKNAQSGSGLLSKMKGHRTWSGQSKGKSANEHDSATPEDGEMDEEDEVDDYSAHGTDDASHYFDAPRSPLDLDDPHAFEASRPPVTPTPIINGHTQSSTSLQLRSEARGMTPWEKLQSYNVKWDHSVNVVVQMDVHRETGDLLPNELKLVVMQVSTISAVNIHYMLPSIRNRASSARLGIAIGVLGLGLVRHTDSNLVSRSETRGGMLGGHVRRAAVKPYLSGLSW